MQDDLIRRISAAIQKDPFSADAYSDMLSLFENEIHAGHSEYHARNKAFRDTIAQSMSQAMDRKQFSCVERLGMLCTPLPYAHYFSETGKIEGVIFPR